MKIKDISEEIDFKEYLRLLSFFSGRYTVLIAASDTAVGYYYTKEHQKLLTSLGLKYDLVGKYRLGYVALIDEGKVILEYLAHSPEEIVEKKIILDNVEIELTSICFNAPKANCALLKIDGKNYSPSMRGLNIVVFDKVTRYLLDAVNFDTLSEVFACHRPKQIIDGVNNFLKNHPGVSFVCFNRPSFPTKNRTKNEEFIVNNSIGRVTILNNLDKPIFAIHNYYDVEGIKEVLRAPKSYHDINGVRRFEDIQGKYVNTIGGHRVTLEQPKDGKRTIFLLGGCHIFGVGASDSHTIATFLQKLLNKTYPKQKFIVQNYGYYLMEAKDVRTGEELNILNNLPVKSGDIILWNFTPIPDYPFINMADSSYEERENEIFTDTMHLTPDGYLLMAKELFKGIIELNILQEGTYSKTQNKWKNNYGFNKFQCEELQAYKQILKNFYHETFIKTIGAVVMNCNPFTYGHRYLIEEALKQCDYLVIFVVEEELSFFSFDERIALVDEGTKDLENIVVIPSGRFIISSLTFSEYFNKSEIQDRIIDTSLDITVFAREIAPCLNITKRFAGEEPIDKITKQYNESMKKILPEYGIEFIEIPRMKAVDMVISASKVRQAIEERDHTLLKQFVPDTTYEFLLEKFEIHEK